MAKTILIIGGIGGGKSASLRNIPAEKSMYIAADLKGLPWVGYQKKWKTVKTDTGKTDFSKTNFYETNSFDAVLKISRAVNEVLLDREYLIIDTVSNLMTDVTMNRATERGYDKFTEMAAQFWHYFREVAKYRDDLTVMFLWHTDLNVDATGVIRKSIFIPSGKLLIEKAKPASIMDVIVEAKPNNDPDIKFPYVFSFENNGTTITRRPMGLFDGVDVMDNDVMLIVNEL